MTASTHNSRKNTLITNRSTNGSSIMITSSNDGSASHISNVMNSSVTVKDSLYYICLNVKKRLDNIPQLQPYLNLAYSSSELLSERQSLLLSQRQQQLLQTNNTAMSATPTTSRISTLSTNSIIKDDFSLDNNNSTMEDTLLTFSMGILPISMDCDPVTQLSQLFQQGSPLCIIFNMVKPQFKLPVVSSDDLKICKKSIYDFILGCKQHFAFNDEELFTISDVFANSTNHLIKVIEVVSTIMDSAPDIFPSKDKIQQEIDEEITVKMNKYSQKYDDYTKVIREFVNTERKYVHDLEILETYKTQLLNSNIITSEELYMLFPNLSDAIDFQRRFLISLEINSLVAPTKQRIGALFMHSKWFFKLYEPWSIGQNAAIDFLTTTLENLNKSNFNEPSSYVISNKLELQSFLYKPVQRLCRYPLLLKELTSCNILSGSSSSEENLKSMTTSTTSTSSAAAATTLGTKEKESNSKSKELEVALDISKSIARSINENQRRTENHQVVKKLYGRVINWKGYRIAKFGELLYFDNVFISTNNSNDQEREFEVYLFEKIIILFQQVNNGNGNGKNKTSSLMLKKKTTSSSLSSASTLTLSSLNHSGLLSGNSSNSNNNNNNNSSNSSSNNFNTTSSFTTIEPKLDLRGRIMIMNLSQISPMSNRSLSITWESIKEQGNFILKFKNEETRDNWSSCLQSLVRNMKSESYKSNASETSFISSSSMRNSSHNNSNNNATLVDHSAHDSISSFGNNAMKHISDMLPKQKKHVSNFENEYRAVSENYKHSIPETSILIRISFNSDFYTLLMELNSTMEEVYEMITKKLNHVGKISKIKYQDEDGDYVILASEDDWLVVKDMLRENNERMLNVAVYANE